MTEDFVQKQKEKLESKLQKFKSMKISSSGEVWDISHKRMKKRVSSAYIKKALKRIEEGKYETCIDCGEKISKERHQVVPGAIRCSPCQKEQEESSNE